MNLEQIDTSTTAGKAEVMRLAAEGRKVAYSNTGHHEWAVAQAPLWDWRTRDYAIIAEPVGPDEVWVWIEHGYPVGVWNNSVAPEAIAGTEVVRYRRADLAGEAK